MSILDVNLTSLILRQNNFLKMMKRQIELTSIPGHSYNVHSVIESRAVTRTLIGGGGYIHIFMFCPTDFFSNCSTAADVLKESNVTFPIRIWNGRAKNSRDFLNLSIPCPFLERKGNCLKGSKCDFFHKSNHFQQRHHLKQYENLPFLEPLQSIKLLLEHVELGLQRFNVAGTRFQQTPISTDLNQYPLMAMSPNRQQLRPHMSNSLMAMPPNRQQLRPLMSHPLAPLHFA